jgi:PBSX family phage terminase large subunit
MMRFKHFAPFSVKQKKLLSWWQPKSPYRDYDGVVAEGSIRSGKTVGMILSFISWSQATFANQNFIVAGKSMMALKRNVLHPMFKMLKALGIEYEYHRAEHYFTIGSNTYWCFGANNEASQDVLQGLTAAGALGDEVALFPQSFVEQTIGRCSVEGSKLFFNCNPESPFHYIKTEIIDKAEEKRFLILHFDLDDNLSLSAKVKERYRRMFTGLFFKRFILGLWVLAEGAIYDMWDEAKHLIKGGPLACNHFIVAVDYGTTNPCTFGLYGWKDKPPVYLLREYWYDSKEAGRQKTDGEYADDFVKWLGDAKPEVIYVDPSAASFIAELRKRSFRVKEATNDVLDGIRFTSGMLTGGEFLVHPDCAHTRREMVAYVWDPKAQQRGEDKPLKQNDHAMDRNRYALFSHFSKGQSGWVNVRR